jgi:hypothetical protein
VKRTVVLIAMVGCGRIGFDVSGGGTGDDDITGDAKLGDALGDGAITALGCVDPGDGDPFTSGTPCSAWGVMMMTQAALTESNGALLLIPTPTAITALGGCKRTGVALTTAGVFAEISQPLAQGDTELAATAGGTTFAIAIRSSTTLALTQTGDASGTIVQFDAIAMRWLRLRPSAGHIVYETSPDGQHWTMRRVSTMPAPATADVSIDVRTPTVVVMPGVAHVEGINVCP